MRDMRVGSMYLGNISVQMLLEVIGLGEITQLVREDREGEEWGREKGPADESKERPMRKGKVRRVDAQESCCCEVSKMKTDKWPQDWTMWWLLVTLARIGSAEWWGWKLKCDGFKHEWRWRSENRGSREVGWQLKRNIESRQVLLGFLLLFNGNYWWADRNNTLKSEKRIMQEREA